MRFALDTNVLVFAVDRDAGEKHRIAIDVCRRARGRDCILTLPALAELFRTPTSPKVGIETKRAIAIVQQWRDVLPVVCADEDCLTRAMASVLGERASFWDAMLRETASRHRCRVILSEDGSVGRTGSGLAVVNPFAPAPDPVLELVLG